ncbi:MAG: Putrescine ABC transporter putrescine-binding protein PotF [uncultured Nocardioidaceae bacterium]|uniref:Putrescine ABC transporter putrescine-binding protein PotF n=1 Tax=uncultured Nocardioidaceae bacterium TaxID=253824 RepID=A0A6J4LEI1_9ACTN|nr:MAG: Putrescine ABC transporter putrescine-binding protein PotF [uncultured Nocardioidaceae bacterium]
MPRIRRTRPVLPPGLVASELSRRSFMRSAAAAGGLGIGVPSLLSACGTEGTGQTAETCKSTDRSSSEKELVWSNWPEYIDVKGKQLPTLEDFEKESGIDVTYNTDVNDNNEFFAKVQNQLGDCQPVNRDIIVLTDWMAARMVKLGWLQKLDHANLPNVDQNLVQNLQGPDWDRKRDYSVPWQSGFTGIAYNKKYTKPVGSFEELMTRPDLKGRISLLKEMRDTMGFMLLLAGADPTDFSDNDWQKAIEQLESGVSSGQIRRFTGNDYVDDLNNGDIAACEAWSGDVIAMQYDNPDIEWVVPEEGLALWSDNMLVPNKAYHKTNAEALMNYYYEPETAARLAAWVNYVCPVQGAKEAMEKIDPSLVDAPLIFPDEAFLAKAFSFKSLDESTAKQYDTDFSQAIG